MDDPNGLRNLFQIMSGDLVPVTRKLNVKSGPGKVMGVVRESYLRSDLSCRSAICFEQSWYFLIKLVES